MASTSSISGLASGLDTATIIDQLMALEKAPQNRLVTKQTAENAVITALRAVNTDTALLASNAATLAKASTWATFKGTSTNTGFTVKTDATTTSGASFSVTVTSIASNHQLGFATAAALGDVVTDQALTLTGSDGTAREINTGGGTLKEVVAAINASTGDTGVTATAIKVADGSYRLLVQSTATGADSSFTLTKADGTDLLGGATVKAGTDAVIDLGLGMTATSSTNTFEEIAPGVSLTLSSSVAVGDTSKITVARDSSSISDSVKALVDQLNALVTSISGKSAYADAKVTGSTNGPLVGDAVTRSLSNSLVNTVFSGTTQSMAAVGIQTDQYGKLTFDATKFADAYAADPAGVAAMFVTGPTTEENGWAARVAAVAKSASDTTSGTLSSAIKSHTSTVDRLQDDIDGWDMRLELKRSALERQYSALETALSNLNSQSSWLSSQISSLPTWSSS